MFLTFRWVSMSRAQILQIYSGQSPGFWGGSPFSRRGQLWGDQKRLVGWASEPPIDLAFGIRPAVQHVRFCRGSGLMGPKSEYSITTKFWALK